LRKMRLGSAAMVALAGTAVMTLVACSGGGSGGSSAPNSPITIGVIVNSTGATAGPYSGSAEVAQAWAKWVNDTQGGVGGHQVQIVAKDDKGDPATATSAAREMVERENAVAVVVQSAVAPTAVASYLASKNIPMLSNDDGQKQPNSPTTWFTVQAGQPAITQSAAMVAKDVGATSMLAAVCSEVAGCAAVGDQLKAYMPSIGSEYKGLVTISADATSATAQCLQIVNSGTAAVAAYIGINAAKNIQQTCDGQGYKGQYVQLASYNGLYTQLATPQLGVLYSFPWWSDATPVKEYRDVMAKYSPNVDYKASGPNATWVSLKLFDFALQKSGPAKGSPFTGADVIKAYRAAVKDVTLDGLLPQPITYAESGNTEIKCFWGLKSDGAGNYQTIPGPGAAGNGVTGDLASQCVA